MGLSAISPGPTARRFAPKEAVYQDWVSFAPDADWLASVKALAKRDLEEGGSGHYVVFETQRGNFYFDRWRGQSAIVWEIRGSEIFKRRRG